MTKEEILARSRREGNREYELKVGFDALGKSVWILAAICILFAFVKIILSDLRGLETVIPFWEFPAILFTHNAVVRQYVYSVLRSKSDLARSVRARKARAVSYRKSPVEMNSSGDIFMRS